MSTGPGPAPHGSDFRRNQGTSVREADVADEGRPPGRVTRIEAVAPGPATRREQPGTSERPATRREDPPVGRPATVREEPAGGTDDSGLPAPVLARYRPVHTLGYGGEAHLVMLVEDRENGEQRVVKLYRGGVRQDGALLAALRGADPDHVVRIDSWGSQVNSVGTQVTWEVMEYVAGGSLAELAKGKLPPKRVREVLTEIAAALRHLHQELRVGDHTGLAHRDVKPANVLVRRQSPLDLVLADFGLVAEAGQSHARTGLGGTPLYQAPETIFRRSRGTAQDWWSLGVIVVELLTGENPLAALGGDTPGGTVVYQHLAAHDFDLTGITDPRWLSLCRGLLTRDPDHRWGAEEVFDWLDGHDPEVYAAPAAAVRATAPLELGGERCFSLETLAAQMAKDWAGGCRLFTDRDRHLELRAWLDDNFGGAGIPGDLIRSTTQSSEEASRRVARLVSYLAPGQPPELDGRPADAAGLAGLADDAVAGDPGARRLIGQLDDTVLAAFGRHHCASPGHRACHHSDRPGCQVLLAAARRLPAVTASLADLAGRLRTDPEIGPDGIAALDGLTDPLTVRAAVLRALVDPSRESELRRRVGRQRRARERQWWDRLAVAAERGPEDGRLATSLVALAVAAPATAQTARLSGETREQVRRTRRVAARGLQTDLVNLLLAIVVLYLATFAAGAAYEADRHAYGDRHGPEYAKLVGGLQQWVLVPAVILLCCLLIRPGNTRRALGWAVTLALGAGGALALLLWTPQARPARSPIAFGAPVQGWLSDLSGAWGPRYGVGGIVCGIAAIVLARILYRRDLRTTAADRSPVRTAVKLGVLALVVALYAASLQGLLPHVLTIP